MVRRCATNGSSALLRNPVHRVAIILETLGVLQLILGRIHYKMLLVVLGRLELDGMEGNGNVLLACPEKAADADDEGGGLAVLIQEQIQDLADLVVLRIVDVLLVPFSNRHAVGRNGGQDLRMRRGFGRLRRGSAWQLGVVGVCAAAAVTNAKTRAE